MCLTGYIGIKGECTTTPKMYIDDLPGINIINVSDVIEGLLIRPSELVDKAFNLAIDQVYSDWINHVNQSFDYLAVISDNDYKLAGKYNFYGEIDKVAAIRIYRNSDYERFINTSVYYFGIVSDRIITKEFVIIDEYGTEIETIEADLVVGFNKIPISVLTESSDIRITFDLSDFKVGRLEDKLLNGQCGPCRISGCQHCIGVVTEISDDDFETFAEISELGFNLRAKCVTDKCALIEYFFENLKVPLLYKTGINYLIEAKMTSRVNSYTRNSQEKIDELLTLWQGGTDTVTGIKTNSAYWQALKSGAESTISTLKSLNLQSFGYNGSQIVNMLP